MNEPIYEQMQQLIQQIRQADTAYYKHDAPIMSDLEYDRPIRPHSMLPAKRLKH